MRLEISRNGMLIYPENPMDEAFLEDVLGLKKNGDRIALSRCDRPGQAGTLACLETVKP